MLVAVRGQLGEYEATGLVGKQRLVRDACRGFLLVIISKYALSNACPRARGRRAECPRAINRTNVPASKSLYSRVVCLSRGSGRGGRPHRCRRDNGSDISGFDLEDWWFGGSAQCPVTITERDQSSWACWTCTAPSATSGQDMTWGGEPEEALRIK